MMQIKFNFNNFARVCHSLAACQRHALSSLAAVIGLSNNDVISLRSSRSLRYVRCVGWKPRFAWEIYFIRIFTEWAEKRHPLQQCQRNAVLPAKHQTFILFEQF